MKTNVIQQASDKPPSHEGRLLSGTAQAEAAEGQIPAGRLPTEGTIGSEPANGK